MLTEFLLIVLLILANGVFAGAEIAVVALRPSRARELAERGSRSARAVLELRRSPERFLSTVQVGITVVGATAAAFGGARFARDLEPFVRRVEWMEPYAPEIALGVVVALVSYLSLMLGELVPKSLALRAAESYALLVARPLLALSWLLQPGVWFLTKGSNAVLRLFGDRTDFVESRLSLAELRTLVDDASAGGSVPQPAGAIATRALEFAELTAGDVMVHRRFVVGVSSGAGEEEVRATILASGHQRFPVFDGSLDNVVGYVSWRDIVEGKWRGEPFDLARLQRKCHFVPEARPAPALLEDMRRRRIHMAVAVDEHGGTAGIVTLEDLLEELVGEIVSEHAPLESELLRREPDGAALVVATVAIRDVNRELDTRLQTPEDVTTIGGLCVALAGGRIPRTGESFRASDGSELEIVDATPRRVRSVRVRRP